MIRKPVNELNFVQAREPMSTVEIDLDALPEDSFGYAQLVETALAPLVAAEPDLRATVYVYQGPSVNFGAYGFSAFFGVAGDRRVLSALYSSFCSAPGLKVRYSDQIQQSQAIREYHLEQGQLWRPYEEYVWYAGPDEQQDEALDEGPEEEDDGEPRSNATSHPDESAAVECFESGDDDLGATAAAVRVELPARFRAARSDASVGKISRSIEAVFGLPEGSVALRGPDRKVLRSDATIRTLRKRWE